MKSFNTLVLAASAAVTSAQFTTNPDGSITCAVANAAYCAGDSLSTNIIIRCIGTVGQPGNCNDNLDGEPPFGLNFAPCWQPSATSGEAACSKNCIVYGGSGNYNGTFTLPDCTPTTTVTTSTTAITTPTTTIVATSSVPSTNGSTEVVPTTTITASGTGVGVTTLVSTVTGSGSPSGGASGPAGNGTGITSTAVGGSATATPVGPTTSLPVQATGAAVANQAGTMLAAGGLLLAYFL